MMSVEESQAVLEPEPEESGSRSRERGWEHLAEALEAAEIEYIQRCLEGSKPDFRLEKAVNSVALDVVGDVILDGGEVIEDYIEEVRRAVGRL